MVQLNPGFQVTSGKDEFSIFLGEGLGSIVFQANSDLETLDVRLPVGGSHTYSPSLPRGLNLVFTGYWCHTGRTSRYRFDHAQGRWLSSEDGHDLEGIVTRDLLRQCAGCPDF